MVIAYELWFTFSTVILQGLKIQTPLGVSFFNFGHALQSNFKLKFQIGGVIIFKTINLIQISFIRTLKWQEQASLANVKHKWQI